MRYTGGHANLDRYSVVYAVPVRPGVCRTFFGIGIRTSKLQNPLNPAGLMLRLQPHWTIADLHGTADEDVVMMHTQARHCRFLDIGADLLKYIY